MYQLSVRAGGRLTEVSQFENVVVNARGGAIVRVTDAASVAQTQPIHIIVEP